MDTQTYRIKNWEQFQHYKNRTPTWIKFYRSILDDAEWHILTPVCAKTLVMLWLLASETNGILPCTKKIAFRLRVNEKDVTDALSQLNHWVICDASTVLADGYKNAILEKELELELELDKEKSRSDASTVLARKPRAQISDEQWIEELKQNQAYAHIDFQIELGKMDAWLSLPKNKHRRKTRSFILNWLNKIEKPLSTNRALTCLVQEKKPGVKFLQPCGALITVRPGNAKPEAICSRHIQEQQNRIKQKTSKNDHEVAL